MIINTDIQDTTIVGAYVARGNGSLTDVGSIVAITAPGARHVTNDFGAQTIGQWNDMGAYMLTVQNKSVDGLALTGSYYYGPNYGPGSLEGIVGDASALWGDASYNSADFPITAAVQGGYLDRDIANVDSTTAFGAKIGGKLGPVSLTAAYSSVDVDDTVRGAAVALVNLGTHVKTPLYTQMVLNQIFIDGGFGDVDTWEIKAVYKGLGGKLVAAYGSSDNEADTADYNEFDFIYATKFNTSVWRPWS